MPMIASKAATALEAVFQKAVKRMIAAVAIPDIRAPTTYLQTAPINADTPNPIGFPAYQNAGMRRIQ